MPSAREMLSSSSAESSNSDGKGEDRHHRPTSGNRETAERLTRPLESLSAVRPRPEDAAETPEPRGQDFPA
jgi:hypothetical protein